MGLVVYSRKEGRALGEVTKFLVYNARKRRRAAARDKYFLRTECVAAMQDMRFQELMPDVLHWLGIRKIHRLRLDEQHEVRRASPAAASRSASASIPDELVPADAKVEIEAKIAAIYFTDGDVPRRRGSGEREGSRPVSDPHAHGRSATDCARIPMRLRSRGDHARFEGCPGAVRIASTATKLDAVA